jgi:hypothetical protein
MSGQREQKAASRTTLVITNCTKVAGVALGLHAGFAPVPDSRVLALAALMVAGGQFSETLILAALDRFFGPGE